MAKKKSPKPKAPKKPRNYKATDITRINLYRIDFDLLALTARIQTAEAKIKDLEARMAGGPLPTFAQTETPKS